MYIGVDDFQYLDDAPIKFEYGKDLLPDWALTDCPPLCKGFIIGTRGHVDLGSKPYMLRAIRYSDLRGYKSLKSCSI